MNTKNIRNFSIIAHIDHGKSTLADRMLELTHTVEGRNMKEQVLDSMELERERGITIKMQPVRMEYKHNGENYILNLIDTPGHIDFSYEVSRSLKAVEGSILLVDATQGIQAQTLTTLWMALEEGLEILPVLSKVDSPLARVEEIRKEVVDLIGCKPEDVLECSGKTGQGVDELIQSVIVKVPPPTFDNLSTKPGDLRSLVFDFEYSNHKGVIVYVRVIDGVVKKGDPLIFKVAGKTFTPLEVGVFSPKPVARDSLSAGEIGYFVTGIKESNIASVGDTVSNQKNLKPAFSGYQTPKPIVWASVYPKGQDDFSLLKQELEKMKLSDSSISFEEESSYSLGKGFRCGFLGMLHLEIVSERLKRESGLDLIVTTPTVIYSVTYKNGKQETIYSAHNFPEGKDFTVFEPWVALKVISPREKMNSLMPLIYEHEGILGQSENVGQDRVCLSVEMPLRELMRGFFDRIKSASSGFASVSYEMIENRPADVVRLDILVADELMPIFSRVVASLKVDKESKKVVEKLYKTLPRQMFTTKIQAKAGGKILASRTLSALKKDVTAHLYGGDITRKMKLREKQKKGKKRMKERGRVDIPSEVFIKMMQEE